MKHVASVVLLDAFCRCRRHVPAKIPLNFNELDDVISHKLELLVNTCVRTSNFI
jgi:hypothetical protein